MPCDISEKNGITTIICSRGRRPQPCTFDGCNRDGSFLCDFPIGAGKTCDRRICGRHARTIAKNVQHCITHPREFEKEK
jgi:hypothetical protein